MALLLLFSPGIDGGHGRNVPEGLRRAATMVQGCSSARLRVIAERVFHQDFLSCLNRGCIFTPRTGHRFPLHDLDIKTDVFPILYDLAHVAGWDPYNLHDLAHVS